MRKINKKVMIMNSNDWSVIMHNFSHKFNQPICNIERMMLDILHNEGISTIEKNHDSKSGIIEVLNMPKKECCTMYNCIAFQIAYEEKFKQKVGVR